MAGWYFRRLKLWRPLRLAAVLTTILALCDPRFQRLRNQMDLWVLVDRSASAQEMVDQGIDEWKKLLQNAKPGAADRLRFVDYASEVVTQNNAETALYPASRGETRTALALEDVLALADRDRHTRILAFTDGYSTEPLGGIAEKLKSLEIPLDFRLLTAPQSVDWRVDRLELPARAQVGEPYVIDVALAGNSDAEIPLVIVRDGQELGKTLVKIAEGKGTFRFTDRLASPGGHRYEVSIAPEKDAFPGNNRFEGWVDIVAGPRVVLLTKYPDDPVAAILRAQGFLVEMHTDASQLTVGNLAGAKNVIFNNVPAWEVPIEFLKALDFFVTSQGGGLMMIGGKQSFGAGGYFESPLDPLMPVAMELRSEHRKLAVAMAIVMDRSGSMGMTVASGHTKMALADEGAARGVELLGDQDLVTVYAVDSSAHEVAPLLQVGKSRSELVKRIRGVESTGGGIYVYTGLRAAWESLKKAEYGQRHIILFTDAADSEEPGDYRNLIDDMTKNGATISVIGLGTKADSDAAFIEDIAKRGKGRMFFTEDAANLPNIFAQETVSVARSTFVEEAVSALSTGTWHEIANRDLDWLKQVDGYNLSYVRPGDAAALVSTDEYKAPLVAYGRRGIGRSAAVSFPMGGDFSTKVCAWPKLGDFVQTANRWLMGDPVPPGIGIRQTLDGSELTLELLYDDEWIERIAANPPRAFFSKGLHAEETSELTWERLQPGHFTIRTPVKEGEVIRGAVQLGKVALPFGPLVLGSSHEWAFDKERVNELRAISSSSGGRELLDLSKAWLRPVHRDYSGILPWLATALLMLILLEALITRTGWRMPEWSAASLRRLAKPSKARQKTGRLTAAPPVVEVANEAGAAPSTQSPPPLSGTPGSPTDPAAKATPPSRPEDPAQRQSRFSRAKKGGV